MRIDLIDAGKATLVGIAWIGSIIGMTELLSRLEDKWTKKHGSIQILRDRRKIIRSKDKQDRNGTSGNRKKN